MSEILYLLVGVVVGVAICPAIQYAQEWLKDWKSRRSVEIVDETKPVQCGACRNIILEPPIRVIVSKQANFRLYQCRQCSTHVTIPI